MYGEEFTDRAVCVVHFTSEDAAEEFKTFLEGENPLYDLIPDAMKEGNEEMMQEQSLMAWTQFRTIGIPYIKRVGNDLILTRDTPFDLAVMAVQPFAGVTANTHVKIRAEGAYPKDAQTVIQEKKHPLFLILCGGHGSVDVELDDSLVQSAAEVTGMSEAPPGKLGSLLYKMFKGASITAESDDISALPQNIQDTLNSDFLTSQFDVWGKASEGLSMMGKIPEILKSLGQVEGDVQVYFPLTDVGALRMTGYSQGFWDALTSLIGQSTG